MLIFETIYAREQSDVTETDGENYINTMCEKHLNNISSSYLCLCLVNNTQGHKPQALHCVSV